MSKTKPQSYNGNPAFLRADELSIRFQFDCDSSEEGKQRSQQAIEAIAIIVSLANRRGRPRNMEELNEAAA